MDPAESEILTQIAYRVRLNVLELSAQAKSAHAGSALSCIEILTSIFWLRYRAKENIKKFVLSKGHAAMALYASALEFGLLEREVLQRYLGDETLLWGHPSVSQGFEFIHWSTGSLGHGLPACVGFAYAEKYLLGEASAAAVHSQAVDTSLVAHKGLDGDSGSAQVIAVISDGEINEGSNWESLMFAGHKRLNNLVVIVDYNKIQSYARCKEVMDLEPLVEKFKSFGFECKHVDGHSAAEICREIRKARLKEKPTCLIADTIKGKGVPEIEDTVASHYKPITLQQLEAFKNAK